MARAVPDDVQRFLTEVVVSVECLDVLLFLYRHPKRWWAAEKLALELGMSASTVQLHLEHLSARNLLDVRLAESVIFRYKPTSEELSGLVEAVASAHHHQRDSVVAVLVGRRASESARLFAEAFQFKRGRPDG